MKSHYDAVVIGSGFGGAITARRLAEKGMSVLVLERGRRWDPSTYPRTPKDDWIFSDRHPQKLNGWLDLRFYGRMTVALGAGVGGGSLCYSAVAIEPDPKIFDAGWPSEITYDELKPYYDLHGSEMNLQTIPDNQLPRRYKIAAQAAENLGYGDRYNKAGLVMNFDKEWNYDLPDAVNKKHSKLLTNKQGVQQGTCVHLGNCDIGCDVKAKNSMDFNYIPAAEKAGAEVVPLHVVNCITPKSGGGYEVAFDNIESGRRVGGTVSGDRVIVAAGAVGSPELLLHCRDNFGTLPNISKMLGKNWNGNANFLSFASYPKEADLRQATGPAIAGVMDFSDGSFRNQRFLVEDDGYPNLLLAAVKGYLENRLSTPFGKRLLKQFEDYMREDSKLSRLMVWLGAGADAADATLYLRRHKLLFWKKKLDIDYPLETSKGVFEAIQEMHKRLSEATQGKLLPNPQWDVFKTLVTLHPLGGCNMGDTAETGVVNHVGEVYGYPGLYVVDGAMVPMPTVHNPTHTIGALAERSGALIN